MHWYPYERLIRDAELPPGATTAAVGAFIIGAIAVLLAFSRAVPTPWGGWVHRFAFTWMGSIFIVDVLLLVGDAILVPARVFGGATTWVSLDLARERAATTVVAAAVVIVRALRNASLPAPVRRVEVRPDRWPASLDGLTITGTWPRCGTFRLPIANDPCTIDGMSPGRPVFFSPCCPS